LQTSQFTQLELIQLIVDEIRTNPVKTPAMSLLWKIQTDILRLNGQIQKSRVEGVTPEGHKASITAETIMTRLQKDNPNDRSKEQSPHTVIPSLSTADRPTGNSKPGPVPAGTPGIEGLGPDQEDVS
jgi:hypothetical protein